MPGNRSQGAVAATSLVVALLLGVAVAALPPTAVLVLGALTAYAVLLVVVSSARDPRKVAIRVLAVMAMGLSWTAVTFGPLSIRDLLPVAMLPVAVIGMAPARPRPTEHHVAVTAPVLICVGGLVAAVMSGGAWILIATFAMSAVVLMVAMYLLRPDRHEVNVLLCGLLAGIVISLVMGLVQSGPSGRAIGLTIHSNQLAMTLLMMIPVTVHLMRESVLPRVAGWCVLAVIAAGVLQTGSRSGLLGLAIVLLVWSYHRRGFFATIYLAVAGLALAAAAVFGLGLDSTPAIARLLDPSATAASDAGRLQLLTTEFEAIIDGHMLLGTGFIGERLPHNILLLVWGGFGLLGLLAWGWLMVRLLLPTVQRSSRGTPYLLGLACLGFATVVSLNNLVDAGFFWLMAGIVFFRTDNDRDGAAPPAPMRRAPAPA